MIDARCGRILERASRAPSGHNAQPWSVRIETDYWVVSADPSRRLPAVDGDDRELMISLGAFVEALIVSGAADGLRFEPMVKAGEVHLALTEMRPVDGDVEELALRRTIRGPYEERPLEKSDVDAFSDAAYFARSNVLREATVEANRAQAFRDDAQRELIEWIRWTKKEANTKRDGLSLAALGIPGVTAWIAETFLNKQRLLTKTSRESQAVDAGKAIDQSGGWLVITGTDLLDAGRRLLRLWLRARRRNVAIQPMSQALEESPWRETLGAQLGLTERPQMILRVGYGKSYPAPASLRRGLDAFVVTS